MKIKVSIITCMFLLFIFSGFCLIENVKASGTTFYVGGSGSGNYSSIQDAINASSNGDTVFVYSGTYYENIVVDKSITLQGQDMNNTIIDGGDFGSENVVNLSADQITFTGFTITQTIPSPSNFELTGYMSMVGVYLDQSQYCQIKQNIIKNNREGGIRLYSSSNNTIQNNNINNNDAFGIKIDSSSSFNYISNNNINNNDRNGIMLTSSTNNIITNNTMEGNSIALFGSISDWTTHTITNNLVNDKPVIYWKNINGGNIPEGAGQVILANCTDVKIESQDLKSGTFGIELGFSSNCIIKDNNISNNQWCGIYLYSSNNNIIEFNNLSNNDGGIGLLHCYKNMINNNNLNIHNLYGIKLDFSNNNTIEDNIVNNNSGDGNGEGISLYSSSSNNYIYDNHLENNDRGIMLGSSDNNIIVGNKIISNEEYGIVLGSFSKDNYIYHNNFMNNSLNTFLYGGINIWSNTTLKEGNYWDNYTGIDSDGNGIGDTPYIITDFKGEVQNQDSYPLIQPYNKGKRGESNGVKNDNGVPGFEIITLIAAIGFILFLIRRKNT